jgi:hypothetical protein
MEAVEAVVDGKESAFRDLLRRRPELIQARSPARHRATLLHYVAANGVDPQRSPPNAPTIARMLLESGAEVDALASFYDGGPYSTPLCLTVTSDVPAKARVQVNLVDAFLDHGAKINGVDRRGRPAWLGASMRVHARG